MTGCMTTCFLSQFKKIWLVYTCNIRWAGVTDTPVVVYGLTTLTEPVTHASLIKSRKGLEL